MCVVIEAPINVWDAERGDVKGEICCGIALMVQGVFLRLREQHLDLKVPLKITLRASVVCTTPDRGNDQTETLRLARRRGNIDNHCT